MSRMERLATYLEQRVWLLHLLFFVSWFTVAFLGGWLTDSVVARAAKQAGIMQGALTLLNLGTAMWAVKLPNTKRFFFSIVAGSALGVYIRVITLPPLH